MSLADLYRTDSKDLSQNDSSDDDGEFVLEEEEEGGSDSSNASDNDDDNNNGDISKATETETAVASEQQKRRIDDIWKEMNAPAEEKHAEESVRVKADNNESKAGKRQNEVDDGSAGDKESIEADNVPKKLPAEADAPRKRRRPVSKFSKMAEMVEQRRAKRENTLDTARRQWTGFVDSQGIRDDLSRANKDGYVERQDFLRRVDERTYQNSRSQQK
ncbi:hypothetical protein IWW48_004955 [Coemansia sp. RSA 1200]|nr:hypothetical protein IWW48_004955 [Coemansia sp. RSA 1200]